MTEPMGLYVPNEEDLDGLDDNTLATVAHTLKEDSARAARMAGVARNLLRRRMVDRNATVLPLTNWELRLKPGHITHSVDSVDDLWQSLHDAGLPLDDIALALPTPPTPARTVSHKVLNDLVKRGGDVKQAIEAHRLSVRDDPTLDMKEVQRDTTQEGS